ncbi:hypothetical protein ACGFJC_47455 [Nonomuraea fuscirosea]|uniref:hypothetical protein n=1 Tax=Nonomuraea fuscirosea TaxID=1291556 RepID=UPI0037107F44
MSRNPRNYINHGCVAVLQDGSVNSIAASIRTAIGTVYPCIITTGQPQNLTTRRWGLIILILVFVLVTSSGVELTIAIPAGK